MVVFILIIIKFSKIIFCGFKNYCFIVLLFIILNYDFYFVFINCYYRVIALLSLLIFSFNLFLFSIFWSEVNSFCPWLPVCNSYFSLRYFNVDLGESLNTFDRPLFAPGGFICSKQLIGFYFVNICCHVNNNATAFFLNTAAF